MAFDFVIAKLPVRLFFKPGQAPSALILDTKDPTPLRYFLTMDIGQNVALHAILQWVVIQAYLILRGNTTIHLDMYSTQSDLELERARSTISPGDVCLWGLSDRPRGAIHVAATVSYTASRLVGSSEMKWEMMASLSSWVDGWTQNETMLPVGDTFVVASVKSVKESDSDVSSGTGLSMGAASSNIGSGTMSGSGLGRMGR